ncbi:hypothetical protein ACLOJK_022354 [Asimina triloba]
MGKYTLKVHGLQYTAGAPVSVLHRLLHQGRQPWLPAGSSGKMCRCPIQAIQNVKDDPQLPNPPPTTTICSILLNVEQPSSTLQQRPNPPSNPATNGSSNRKPITPSSVFSRQQLLSNASSPTHQRASRASDPPSHRQRRHRLPRQICRRPPPPITLPVNRTHHAIDAHEHHAHHVASHDRASACRPHHA